METAKIGRAAFMLGVIIAVLLGFVTFNLSTLLLVILGLIVGFLNISAKETSSYLIAVIALLVIGFSGLQVFAIVSDGLSTWVQSVLASFVIFVAASGLVVALKAAWELGQEK
ncbi:MAG: hypothetical protein A2Y57_00760 [Candidatus Woykebacteria bacterium RBG_13_40_7b]|uniref:Major facilitator superfamily (MFS) profile domain-containing protein n=1 Tax=Candidatus Woykebacteria bacterium RBG_13_40_7b TaxID=1802594 RepID=A0A1G1WBE4_9BACT|nr:MAG: hypothetical protein A2Y57_00760 [Candidatus Woykebacteria bacterium RBG_13_40_7b]